MSGQKRKKHMHEEDLLECFEKRNKKSDVDDENDKTNKTLRKIRNESKDIKISPTFPHRPPYDQYSQIELKINLVLKNNQEINPHTTTTLVTTCVISHPIDDYCLLVQPNDFINNLFVMSKMFIFSHFVGRISVPVQNFRNEQIKLEAGTVIGEIHFIAFGIK